MPDQVVPVGVAPWVRPADRWCTETELTGLSCNLVCLRVQGFGDEHATELCDVSKCGRRGSAASQPFDSSWAEARSLARTPGPALLPSNRAPIGALSAGLGGRPDDVGRLSCVVLWGDVKIEKTGDCAPWKTVVSVGLAWAGDAASALRGYPSAASASD